LLGGMFEWLRKSFVSAGKEPQAPERNSGKLSMPDPDLPAPDEPRGARISAALGRDLRASHDGFNGLLINGSGRAQREVTAISAFFKEFPAEEFSLDAADSPILAIGASLRAVEDFLVIAKTTILLRDIVFRCDLVLGAKGAPGGRLRGRLRELCIACQDPVVATIGAATETGKDFSLRTLFFRHRDELVSLIENPA